MVNDKVSKVYESISNKRGKYLTLTPAQRFEVGKRAAERGITAAALACFDNKLQIVCRDFPAPFSTPVPLLEYGVIPYQLILMVASNHRFY